MSDLQEKKRQPPRYPMGTIRQARNTVARLTRDLLNGKIDKDKYRAACYGLSVQCGLFKLETPEKKDVDIKIEKPDFLCDPEERKARINELLHKMQPFNDDHLQYANKRADDITSKKIEEQEIDGIEKDFQLEDMMAEISEGDGDNQIEKLIIAANKNEGVEKPQQGTEQPTPWKQSGIGVKRG